VGFLIQKRQLSTGAFSTKAKPDYSEVESGAHNSDRAVDAAEQRDAVSSTPSITCNWLFEGFKVLLR